LFRFDLDAAERHAESAIAASTRLALGKTRAVVLVFRARTQLVVRAGPEED
jgi:hypothetical protein